MREYEKDFEKRNVAIVIITFEAGFFAQSYIAETGVDWPILVDEDRSVYNFYGMKNAGFWDIWGPKTWLAYIKQFAQGRFLKQSEGDVSQRGGNVLIDPQGIIQLHHVGQGPADRPSVTSLLRAIDQE